MLLEEGARCCQAQHPCRALATRRDPAKFSHKDRIEPWVDGELQLQSRFTPFPSHDGSRSSGSRRALARAPRCPVDAGDLEPTQICEFGFTHRND